MAKTATIKISLVQESDNIPNEQLEQEILSHLNQLLNGLPWQHAAESVKVSESAPRKLGGLQLELLSLSPIKVPA